MKLLEKVQLKESPKIHLGDFGRKYGNIFILIFMCLVVSTATHTFSTAENLVNVLRQVSMNGIIALGMTFVIISGGIDLSVGSIVAVTSVICGRILSVHTDVLSVFIAIGLSILAAILLGLFNGFLVSRFNMFPFVVTLSTMMVIRGIAYLLSNAQSYIIMSDSFYFIGVGKIGPIPVPVIIFLILVILTYLLLSHTRFGRYVYSVGGNSNAALASGVNIKNVRLLVYAICSVLTCIAGVITSSRVNAGQPNLGTGYETDAIAAAVIGGTSLTGGIGTIPGTVIGILIIGVINNGMNLLKVSSFWQMIAKGMIIIIAVLIDLSVNRRRRN